MVLGLMLESSISAAGQDQPPAEGQVESVSGTLSEVSSSRIVVNRAVLGKSPEARSFLITGETKVEGRLRVGARVTVGFRITPEGEVALRVIVRGGPPAAGQF
ncbi:MAG TPA: hypothetical protein VEQ63_02930 [Bryobacteraceae bacterium]|nr:hypothetical protein [Bryobacteraceae bacterium]